MNTESVKLAIHFLFNTYYHVKWGGVDDGGGGEDDGDRIMEDIVNSLIGSDWVMMKMVLMNITLILPALSHQEKAAWGDV